MFRATERISRVYPVVLLLTAVVALLPTNWLYWTRDLSDVIRLPITPVAHAGNRLAGMLRPVDAGDGLNTEDLRGQLQLLETERDRYERLYRAQRLRSQELAAQLRLLQHLPESVLRAPGVLQAADDALDVEGLWPTLRKALRAGLRELLAMRATEGAHLQKDLSKRIANMRKAVKTVGRRAPKTVERHRRALMERLSGAGLGFDTSDERVLKEVAIFADRIDISEELTRLESHFKQFATAPARRCPWGAHWIFCRRK